MLVTMNDYNETDEMKLHIS